MKVKEYQASTKTLVETKRRELVDQETGEKIIANHIVKKVYGCKHFWKIYLMDFMSALGIFDNKQLDVFVYIAENTNPSNNTFLGTYKHISESVHVSQPTIARIMKKLQENNIIKRIQNGAWLVNPNILMKGDDTKRQILLSYYNEPDPIQKINK